MSHARQIHDALVIEIRARFTIEFNPARPPDKYDETLVMLNDDKNIEIIYAAKDHVLIQENSATADPSTLRRTFVWVDADLIEQIKNVILEWGP